MKKITLATLTLIFVSMACTNFNSYLGGAEDDGNNSFPTTFPTPQPTQPFATLAPTSTFIVPPPTSENVLEPTTDEAEVTAAVDLTPTLGGEPSTSNFYTCTGPCIFDGSNHQTTFAEKIKIIYFTFDYENFPAGASYTRWWTRNGVEWVRYQCAWFGPSSGVEQITLTEPSGLASGTWEVKITVDGEIVLQESLVVEGSWTYWDPAGFFGSCYGKR